MGYVKAKMRNSICIEYYWFPCWIITLNTIQEGVQVLGWEEERETHSALKVSICEPTTTYRQSQLPLSPLPVPPAPLRWQI